MEKDIKLRFSKKKGKIDVVLDRIKDILINANDNQVFELSFFEVSAHRNAKYAYLYGILYDYIRNEYILRTFSNLNIEDIDIEMKRKFLHKPIYNNNADIYENFLMQKREISDKELDSFIKKVEIFAAEEFGFDCFY